MAHTYSATDALAKATEILGRAGNATLSAVTLLVDGIGEVAFYREHPGSNVGHVYAVIA